MTLMLYVDDLAEIISIHWYLFCCRFKGSQKTQLGGTGYLNLATWITHVTVGRSAL